MHRTLYVTVAWGGIATIFLAAIWVAWKGQWRGALVLGVFLLFSIAFVILRRRLPNLFDLLFVVAAMLNAAGYVWELYERLWFYDELAHAFTTFALTLALGFLLYHAVTDAFHGHKTLFALVVGSLGLAIGVLWEIFEYSTNMQSGLPDTIWDLIYDGAGATVAGIVAALCLKPR